MHPLVALHTAVRSLIILMVDEGFPTDGGILFRISTGIERNADGHHVRLLGRITEIELHQSTAYHRRIDNTQFIVARRYMGYLNGEIVDIPSLELIGVMCSPSTHHVEAKQGTRIVADNVVKIGIFESDTVTVTSSIEGTHLSWSSETQAIVDELIEERGGVKAQTLVKCSLCYLVIL